MPASNFKDDSVQLSSAENAPISVPITALVIDDEQLAREELKFLLNSTGNVEVMAEGSNGIEAIELIEELATIPGVAGVHLMAPANEAAVPHVIAEARKRLPQRKAQ